MLTFRGSRFQYFLSVSPQEGLGRCDLNRWILEAQKQRRPLVFMQDDLPSMRAILRVSARSRKAKSDLEEPVPASLPKLDILERQACLGG